jgi:FkbM family methyltransferase
MRDVEVATYVGQNDVLVAPDTLHARRRWGAESDALELAADVLGRFDDPVLVDVGAAAGEWSLLAVVVENLRVFAFEPHTGFASLLRENLQLNGVYGQVSVYTLALGADPGVARLKVPEDVAKWGLSTISPAPGFEPAETHNVCVATLDQFFERQDPTLVKVDAEGGELGVLCGAERTVKRCEPAFVLEVCQKRTEQFGYDADKIGDVMAAYGYNEVQLNNDNRYYWKREGHRP